MYTPTFKCKFCGTERSPEFSEQGAFLAECTCEEGRQAAEKAYRIAMEQRKKQRETR